MIDQKRDKRSWTLPLDDHQLSLPIRLLTLGQQNRRYHNNIEWSYCYALQSYLRMTNVGDYLSLGFLHDEHDTVIATGRYIVRERLGCATAVIMRLSLGSLAML